MSIDKPITTGLQSTPDEEQLIKNDLQKYVPSSASPIFKHLSKQERYFVSLYLETFDPIHSTKMAFDITDESIARMKFAKLSAKDNISKCVEMLLEDAMGPKKVKFEVFKLSRNSFDPMVKFKSLELMARINNMLDGEGNKANITIDLGSALKDAYDKMEIRKRTEAIKAPEIIDTTAKEVVNEEIDEVTVE